jgi:diguanylate cyclase (GGDEF)-like protein
MAETENIMQTDDFDIDLDTLALSFATRHILSDLDHDSIVKRSLDSLADFGRSDRIGLWLVDDDQNMMQAVGGSVGGKPIEITYQRPFSHTPVEDVIAKRTPETYPLVYDQGLPWPVEQGGVEGRKCLCLPLIAAGNRVTGMVTIDLAGEFSLKSGMLQILAMLVTIVAVGIETARLFRLAVIDGLTGLYLRRYMELRLAEEEKRIRRYGGQMALLMADVDHFKKLNDTFGHQQGDVVLQEMAEILQQSVRTGLDVVCRYGGEEFVVIMPHTDSAGARSVAERIRRGCENKQFTGLEPSRRVTISSGLACMDQQTAVSAQELLRRADEALYRAKENGRNRVCVWP